MHGGLRAIPAHGFGAQASVGHESRDPTATDGPAGVDQCARRANVSPVARNRTEWLCLGVRAPEHVGMDLQRGRYGLDLQARLMTQTNRRLLKLVRVLVQLARAGS